jgi:hypothetical protein
LQPAYRAGHFIPNRQSVIASTAQENLAQLHNLLPIHVSAFRRGFFIPASQPSQFGRQNNNQAPHKAIHFPSPGLGLIPWIRQVGMDTDSPFSISLFTPYLLHPTKPISYKLHRQSLTPMFIALSYGVSAGHVKIKKYNQPLAI